MKLTVAVTIVFALAFAGFYHHSSSRYTQLEQKLKKERRDNVRFQAEIKKLEEHLRVESQKLRTLIQEQEKAEQERQENEKRKRIEENAEKLTKQIAAKRMQIEKLKSQLAAPSVYSGTSTASGSKINDIQQQIRLLRSKIDLRKRQLKKIAEVTNDKRFECFSRCIYCSDVKFERKMTKCHVTVPGGVYYCSHHYDYDGYRYHRRNYHRHSHTHKTPVGYECITHNICWNQGLANRYTTLYKENSMLLGNQMKYRNEVAYLQKSLNKLEEEKNTLSKNSSTLNNKTEIQKQIKSLENEIAELMN